MRVFGIAVLFSLALAAPSMVLAQQAPAGTSQEVNTPPGQPSSRARVDAAPNLFERLFGQQQAQQPPQQIVPTPAERAQATQTQRRSARRSERRAERRARRAERAAQRSTRQAASTSTSRVRWPRRAARAQAAPETAAVVEAQQPIPLPPPNPRRAAAEAISTVGETTLATAGADPTVSAYEASDDPRERCHVVLASEAEHDIAEVLRCRVLLQREQ